LAQSLLNYLRAENHAANAALAAVSRRKDSMSFDRAFGDGYDFTARR
jgi:hypothetical protein